ncbi:DUF4240 domain-containing protein [Nonomuraea spiralis]|uniref:DUF4240 domain-containing protein n=1 Tax=Nonomuraea spiralis TaxID=46182 RepID=A0ABV5IWA1_9ACTN|nr:DUF4240 domain-containing protein [Nonomuraea spiralis]GGT47328.1 hypothetical protein GCM10010176_107670 [Nonomuraea spiralis]
MDIDGFWELVERSARETGTRSARLEWLEDQLCGLSAEEIVDYEVWFTVCASRACSWDMYAVYWTITGFGSSDGFEYFVSWLISRGRDAFEKVADCPDRILELPDVQRLFEWMKNFVHRRTTWSSDGRFRLKRVTRVRREVWPREENPEFESFAYVTFGSYVQVTGLEVDSLREAVRARGVDSKFPFLTFHAQPDGEKWDFDDEAEFVRRLPQLARQYGLTR